MTDRPLLVVPSVSLDQRQVDQTEAVYRESFPPHLRVPFAELARPGPAGLMVVAVEGGADPGGRPPGTPRPSDQPVGFAAMLRLRREAWTFLRYYGVAASRRGQGVGERFWRLLQPELAATGWPARIAFEVEDPADDAADEAERLIRRRRVAFWQRCGAAVLAVDRYVMPDISGLAAPEPMRLMACDPGRPPALPAAQLTGLVSAIYAERYGLDDQHPLVAAALASVPG